MSEVLIIPKQHINLFADILNRMGCGDFRENKSKYAPDYTFSVSSESFWGYNKGFSVEFNGTDPVSLEILNERYEYVIKQLEQQENKD